MIGERIRQARRACGMTQADLAKGLVSRSYIAAIESGRVSPSAGNLQILAERLGQPLSHFIADHVDVAMQQIEASLNQAKVHMVLGNVSEAQSILEGAKCTGTRTMSAAVLALYYELQGELHQDSGAIAQSVSYFTVAANEYVNAGNSMKAWECRYSAASTMYRGGYMDQAISLAMEAATALGSSDYRCLALAYYMIGCAYFAKGNVQEARNYFEQARACALVTTEAHLCALLGESSCLFRQGQWKMALASSRQAVALAEQHNFLQLKAEALIGAMACLVQLGEQELANEALDQITSTKGISASLRCKALREMLLTTMETAPSWDTTSLEFDLNHLLKEAEFPKDDWDRVKGEWALEKCRLMRGHGDVAAAAASFAEAFSSIGRLKDAADVLSFGAKLLNRAGKTHSAYSMLSKAYDLLHAQQ